MRFRAVFSVNGTVLVGRYGTTVGTEGGGVAPSLPPTYDIKVFSRVERATYQQNIFCCRKGQNVPYWKWAICSTTVITACQALRFFTALAGAAPYGGVCISRHCTSSSAQNAG